MYRLRQADTKINGRSFDNKFNRYNKMSKENDTSNELDERTTKQLVGNIYSMVDLAKYRYEVIQYESDLQKLLRTKYYMSVNFCGVNSLLIFTKLNDKFYTFTVDRTTLSYNFSKLDFSKIKLNLVNVGLDDSIYNGTIFDGVLIRRYNGDDVFMICDVFKFCGTNMTNDRIDTKLFSVFKYLDQNYNENLSSNNISLKVNKLFPIEEIEKFTQKVMPNIGYKYRGLTFYPQISETKLIFMLENNREGKDNKESQNIRRNKDRNEKVETQTIEKEIPKQESSIQINQEQKCRNDKMKYINMSDNDVYATLEVKITDSPDVYKLFCVEKMSIEGKTILKKVAMGIAFIKGIEISHKMKEYFNGKKSVLMKCKFNNDNSKWEPMCPETTAKIPSLLNVIENELTLMELSDDEE